MRKKSKILILFLFCSIAIISGIKNYNRPLKIHNDVKNAIDLMGFEECHIMKYCGEKVLNPQIIDVEIRNEEIEDYIDVLLHQQAYRVEITDRNIVYNGDLAITDYTIIYNNKEINRMKQEPIRVGSGFYDIQLEEKMIGLEIGKEYAIAYKIPENVDSSEFSGKTVDLKLLITELYNVIVPTIDEYITENEYDDIAEWRQEIELLLYEEKLKNLYNQTVEEMISNMIDTSQFKLNENIVLDNAISFYYEYSNLANIYGQDTESYIKNILGYEGDIYQLCYERSAEEIKRFLVIGMVAEEQKIVITDQDINNFFLENNLANNISEDDLGYIRYQILEDKVISYIREKYINHQ